MAGEDQQGDDEDATDEEEGHDHLLADSAKSRISAAPA
jgi:hypothetical protein